MSEELKKTIDEVLKRHPELSGILLRGMKDAAHLAEERAERCEIEDALYSISALGRNFGYTIPHLSEEDKESLEKAQDKFLAGITKILIEKCGCKAREIKVPFIELEKPPTVPLKTEKLATEIPFRKE
jgi:hypothetical protein